MTEGETELRSRGIFSQLTRFKDFGPGEVIIQEGASDDKVYFILSGSVKVTCFSLKGKEIWHSELSAGRVFGEMAAITGQPRSASITASEQTRLSILSKAELFALIRQDPEIAIWLLEEMARRLATRTEKVNTFIAQSTAQRIHSMLLELAAPDASRKDKLVIQPKPNFSEVARRLNTDRENVSREISSLERQGVLKKTKSFIEILRKEYLEASSAL